MQETLRRKFPGEEYRKFELSLNDSLQDPKAWDLAEKAVRTFDSSIPLDDSKALIRSARDCYISFSAVNVLAQQIQTMSPDLASVYWFGKMNIQITPEQAEKLSQLPVEYLLKDLNFYTNSALSRSFLRFVCCCLKKRLFPSFGVNELVSEYMRRGLDPEYWVFQNIIRELR